MCFEIQSIEENKTGSNKKQEWIYSKGLERDKYKGIRRSKKTQKGFSNPLLRISISKIMWMNNIWLYFGSDLAAWPSGKAGDCKSFIPSSNLGAAWSIKYLGFIVLIELDKFVLRISLGKRVTRPADTLFLESIPNHSIVLSSN